MRRAAAVAISAMGVLLLHAQALDAQRRPRPAGYLGISFVAADPVGELGYFFDEGFGGQISGSFPVAAEGHLRLRGDLGVVVYGYERRSECYSLPVGCRIGLDLTTTNNIFFGGLGPEIVLATGALEPYVHTTFGVGVFFTQSSLSGRHEHGSFASTTHLSDAVYAWRVGGGLRVRLTGGRKPVSLDVGVERHDNGVADFLVEGDIIDHPDGSISFFPNRSEAEFVTFRAGLSIGIPRRGQRR